jgi:hypothetical protein
VGLVYIWDHPNIVVGLVYIWVHPNIVVGLVYIWDHPNIVAKVTNEGRAAFDYDTRNISVVIGDTNIT